MTNFKNILFISGLMLLGSSFSASFTGVYVGGFGGADNVSLSKLIDKDQKGTLFTETVPSLPSNTIETNTSVSVYDTENSNMSLAYGGLIGGSLAFSSNFRIALEVEATKVNQNFTFTLGNLSSSFKKNFVMRLNPKVGFILADRLSLDAIGSIDFQEGELKVKEELTKIRNWGFGLGADVWILGGFHGFANVMLTPNFLPSKYEKKAPSGKEAENTLDSWSFKLGVYYMF